MMLVRQYSIASARGIELTFDIFDIQSWILKCMKQSCSNIFIYITRNWNRIYITRTLIRNWVFIMISSYKYFDTNNSLCFVHLLLEKMNISLLWGAPRIFWCLTKTWNFFKFLHCIMYKKKSSYIFGWLWCR